MTGRPFNRGGLDAGLAEYLGLKGSLRSSIESEIRPVILVSDLSAGPYARDYQPVAGFSTNGPGAAQYGYVGVRPNVGTCLQITRVEMMALGAGHVAGLQLMDDAAVDAVAAAGSTSLTQMYRLLQEFAQPVATPVSRSGAQIADIVSTVNSLSGQFTRFNLPANPTQIVIQFPEPGILLIRRDAANIGGLYYHSEVLDQDAIVTFYGKEWPLPG